MIAVAGEADFRDSPDDRALARFGYQVFRLDLAADATLDVAIDARLAGTAGSAAELRATLVQDSEPPTYTPIPVVDGEGTQLVPVAAANGAVFLVVAAVPDATVAGERFPFRFRVRTDDASDGASDDDDDDGFDRGPTGCASAGAPLWLAVLVWARRRHPRAR